MFQPPSFMAMSSGDLAADRRFEWARDCQARSEIPAAIDLLRQVLELVPDYAAAWFALASLLEKQGERKQAVDAYRKARAADPHDRHGALPCLIRLGAAQTAELPPAYIRSLFDQYAPAFDSVLVGGLNYRPALLFEAVREVFDHERRRPNAAAVLDLGCGTGLAGERFRPVTGHLCGVDLSAGMVAQAHRKAIYDRLHIGDLLEFLEADSAAGNRYDLVIAADVFVYVADLAPVFSAVARILATKALFVFTLEAGVAEASILKDSLRFAHGRSYVSATLSAAGLALLIMREITLRTEKGEPVPGLLVVARHN